MKAIQHKGSALKGSVTSVLAKAAFEATSTLEQIQDENDLGRAQDACRRLREAIDILKQASPQDTKERR